MGYSHLRPACGFNPALRLLDFQPARVTPGMRAALMTPPSADFFALAFALLKLGIVPIIIDPAIGLQKVRRMSRRIQA